MKKGGLGKVFVAATVGYLAGLLLARKPGKKLRKEIQTSKNPVKTTVTEMWEAKKEAMLEMKDWAEHSEELKEVLDKAQAQFDAAMKKAEKAGDSALEEAKAHLDKLESFAKEKMEELKAKGKKFENKIENKVKTIAGK